MYLFDMQIITEPEATQNLQAHEKLLPLLTT